MIGFKQISKDIKDLQGTEILIDPQLILECQIDHQNLICSICHHILWKPLMCSTKNGCHGYICKACIESWTKNCLQKYGIQSKVPCPNCKLVFIESPPPPILKTILNNLKIKCIYSHNGCKQIISYSQIEKHSLNECQYRNKKCGGCGQIIVQTNYNKHTENCSKFIVQCKRCCQNMSKRHYITTHALKSEQNQKDQKLRSTECYSFQINRFQQSIESIETNVLKLDKKVDCIQTLLNKLLTGESIRLKISFHTRFKDHFQFPNPTLVKSSYNPRNGRNEYLHFYINTPIYLNSIVRIHWQFTIDKMKGNILFGFCSKVGGQSVDLIVNRYGQIKRKDLNENKYKLIEKVGNFIIQEKDHLEFTFRGRDRQIIILNKTKKSTIELNEEHLSCFNQTSIKKNSQSDHQCIYPFYSMDTLGDGLTFIQ